MAKGRKRKVHHDPRRSAIDRTVRDASLPPHAAHDTSSGSGSRRRPAHRATLGTRYLALCQLVYTMPAVILAGVFVYILAIVLFCSPSYLMNDNPAMLTEIKLGLPVSFMTVVLGKFLSVLYLHVSAVIPWYPILIYILLGSSLAVAIHGLLALDRFRELVLPFLVMYLLFFTTFLVRTGFNAVAFFTGGHAIFALVAYSAAPPPSRRRRLVVVLLLGILFSFSYMYRPQATTGITIFSAPVLALACLAAGMRRSLRWSTAFVAPLLLVVSLNHVLKTTDVSEDQAYFDTFNVLRGRFHGNPIVDVNWKNKKLFEMNKWSNADYAMLIFFMHLNEKKFNIETLSNIFEHTLPLPSDTLTLNVQRLRERHRALLQEYHRHLWVLPVLILLATATRSRYNVALSVCYAVYIYAGMLAMLYFKRFPIRVGIPLLMISFLMGVYLIFGRRTGIGAPLERLKSAWLFLVAGGCLIIAFAYLPRLRDVIKYNRIEMTRYRADMTTLNEICGDKMVLFQPGKGLRNEFADPFAPAEQRFHTIPAGYTIYSPRFYMALRQLGIDSAYDIFPRIIDHPDAFVVFREKDLKHLLAYIHNTYGVACRGEKIRQLQIDAVIYQLVSKN